MKGLRLEVLFCVGLALFSYCSMAEKRSIDSEDWLSGIRTDHPRLFFNSDTWPAVKSYTLNEEAALFAEIKSGIDELMGKEIKPGDHGRQAAEAAFVFLVTGEDQYLRLARDLLTVSVDYYNQCYREGKSVSWYSFSRINAWAAYDWIYNHLPEGERKALGRSFLKAIENVQPTRQRESFALENWSGPISGFYSTPGIIWYAGLATYREGIDNELAEKWLRKGYELYLELLEYRSAAAGDDGGTASAALNYALAAYPWAEFNFFHTYNSATGDNIAERWPYLAYLPGYLFWNWLPGARYFGTGDSYHSSNRIPLGSMHMHLSQIIHFYGDRMPQEAAFAKWIRQKIKRNDRTSFRFARFLVHKNHPELEPALPPDDLPLSRHFDNMGQIFFRSGYGPLDTYACFTSGGTTEMHKHYDHNNFVIFKGGFLALDTGTRPEPGQHLSHYYCRTVAHNCILIHMPGEQMPRYWGNPAPEEEVLPYPNDGGQRQRGTGSKVVAFETTPHYGYAAGDATETYHQDKCGLALRQLVFLPPDFFVVFDRVVSKKPEFKKTWLLHTATEPRLKGDTFYADQDNGRLFCRTLLPEKPEIATIGGSGRQFWSGGRNWPMPAGYRTPDTTQLLGQWRVEVSPSEPVRQDCFLHLIQLGDQSLSAMVDAELVTVKDSLGVRFTSGSRQWRVVFNQEGPASGYISLRENGKKVVEKALAEVVQRQKGLFGL